MDPLTFGGNFMLPFSLQEEYAVAEIVRRNETSARYGLTLSPAQAQELVEVRRAALQSAGRIELGGGIIGKLILHFCTSPYLDAQNYLETLEELLETFYYFKNESLDRISDDELIEWMQRRFDGICRGSLELLQNRELERLARELREGLYREDRFGEPEESNDWGYEEEDDQ